MYMKVRWGEKEVERQMLFVGTMYEQMLLCV